MTYRHILIAAVATCFLGTSCGRIVNSCMRREKPSDSIVSKTVETGEIHSIASTTELIVHYSQGSPKPVKISGPENIVKELEIDLDKHRNLKLEIRHGSKFSYSSDEEMVHVWITSPATSRFEAAASSRIYIDSIAIPEMELKALAGAAIFVRDVETDIIEVSALSGAMISISGKAKSARLKTLSGGTINAADLKASSGKSSAYSGGVIKCDIRDAAVESFSGGSVSNRGS